jgi:hypothetical protein
MSESVKPEPAAWCWEQYGRANEYCFEAEWFWCYDSTKPDDLDAAIVRNEAPLYTADQLTAAHAAGVRAGMLRAAQMVPTSWLDSLLTGKEAVVGTPPFGCPDIERLLSAIAAAIRSEAEREGEK